MSIPVAIGIVAVILGAAGFVAFSVKHALEGNRNSMQKLAKSLGLPLMRGERARPGRGLFKIGPWTYFILDLWNSRELNVYHIVKGSGKSQVVYAALDVPVEVSKEFKLSFSSNGSFGSIGALQGVSLVSSGDETFDASFIVKCSDANTAKRILSPELRELLKKAWTGFDVRGSLSVREGRVHYEESGWIQSESQRRRFVVMAELSNRLADAITKG
jgi:hypothetical protein